MGPILVAAFLFVFALAIGQAFVRRKLNPFREVVWSELPVEFLAEIDRVLPDLEPGPARITKKGDEARVQGVYLGEPLWIEGEFDRSGRMVEFEVEANRGARVRAMSSDEELPAGIKGEIERILGDAASRFERRSVLRGTSGEGVFYKVRGRVDDWKWEISVLASGRLLEVEKELRGR